MWSQTLPGLSLSTTQGNVWVKQHQPHPMSIPEPLCASSRSVRRALYDVTVSWAMLLMADLTPLNKLFHSRERPVMLFQLFSYTQMYPFNYDKSLLQWPSHMYSHVLQANTITLSSDAERWSSHTSERAGHFYKCSFSCFYTMCDNGKDLLLLLTTAGCHFVRHLSSCIVSFFQSLVTLCLRFPPTPHPPSVILRKFSLVFSDTCLSKIQASLYYMYHYIYNSFTWLIYLHFCHMGVLHSLLLFFFLKLIIKRKRALLFQHMPPMCS